MDYVVRTPRQLGEILKSRRAQRGLTQSSAGKMVGLLQDAVSNIENGTKHPTTTTLFKLLSALELELVIRDKHVDIGTSANKKARW